MLPLLKICTEGRPKVGHGGTNSSISDGIGAKRLSRGNFFIPSPTANLAGVMKKRLKNRNIFRMLPDHIFQQSDVMSSQR